MAAAINRNKSASIGTNNGHRAAPRRIVVRGVNWLGDAVMTMPALCRLREAHPQAHIAVLTPPHLADLYACQPAIDAILTVAKDEPLLALARRLRAENFDTALIFPHSLRVALPFALANIPRRIGYAGRGRTCLLTCPVRPDFAIRILRRSHREIRGLIQQEAASEKQAFPLAPHALPHVHHLHHYLTLTTVLGGDPSPVAPRLMPAESDRKAAAQKFGLLDREDRPLFGMNCGAQYGSAKRWPEENFVAAALELQQRFGCCWLLVGGTAEAEVAARIAGVIEAANATRQRRTGDADVPAVWNLTGRTNLRELCAVLPRCTLFLSNDSGPMHVAASVGVPVVVPFGSTSPTLTGPGLPGDPRHRLLQSSVPCSPCFQRVCPIDFRCMRGISAMDVVSAASEIYAECLSSIEH